MQTFSQCATNLPYSSCILVSSLPGSQKIGQASIVRSNTIDYIRNNIAVYQDTNALHSVGYALFALENSTTAPNGAFGNSTNPNITVQEPWYLGTTFNNSMDPYYDKTSVNQFWQTFASTTHQAFSSR
jgi:hypothetical protein